MELLIKKQKEWILYFGVQKNDYNYQLYIVYIKIMKREIFNVNVLRGEVVW